MRILIDECANPRVRQAFPNHDVVTIAEAEWRTLPDGKLVALAQGNFDVLITIDRGFEFEHNLEKLVRAAAVGVRRAELARDHRLRAENFRNRC